MSMSLLVTSCLSLLHVHLHCPCGCRTVLHAEDVCAACNRDEGCAGIYAAYLLAGCGVYVGCSAFRQSGDDGAVAYRYAGAGLADCVDACSELEGSLNGGDARNLELCAFDGIAVHEHFVEHVAVCRSCDEGNRRVALNLVARLDFVASCILQSYCSVHRLADIYPCHVAAGAVSVHACRPSLCRCDRGV